MDLNIVVLCGTIMTDATVEYFDSGNQSGRLLMSIKQTEPRHRVDVIPVTFWRDDIGCDQFDRIIQQSKKGKRVWVAAQLQRRFFGDTGTTRSGISIIASSVEVRE